MGAGQRFLPLADRLPETRAGGCGGAGPALPPADGSGMGVCGAWSRGRLVPVGDQGGEEREGLLLCQFQARPRRLHGRRKPDHGPVRLVFRQFQRFVRHGGQRGGVDQHRVHGVRRGRDERHEPGAELQCGEGRPLPVEEEVRARRLVEGPRVDDPFRMAHL